MSEPHNKDERVWEKGWGGHEKAQLLRLSRLSLTEKIKWLEQAQETAHKLQEVKASSEDPGDG